MADIAMRGVECRRRENSGGLTSLQKTRQPPIQLHKKSDGTCVMPSLFLRVILSM